MKTFLMVLVTNILIIMFVALASLLWPLIGAVVGYRNSWWLAPLASFGAFLIAGRLNTQADRDVAFRAQYAVFGIFSIAIFVTSLMVRNLGIPAWRVALTLVLCMAGTWLGRAALSRRG